MLLSYTTKVFALVFPSVVLLLYLDVVVMFMIRYMCRYLTANGLCASDDAHNPYPPCEFIRRGREFCECSVYRAYMTELFLYSQYVYDAETDTFVDSLAVKLDLNDFEKNVYVEPPF